MNINTLIRTFILIIKYCSLFYLLNFLTLINAHAACSQGEKIFACCYRDMSVSDSYFEKVAEGCAYTHFGSTTKCYNMFDYKSGLRAAWRKSSCDSLNEELEEEFKFSWSSKNPIEGKFCINFFESSDPHTWHDNFLCSNKSLPMKWSSSGPIENMRCLKIGEPEDPETWHDNYLCVPHESPVYFSWSDSGPISRKKCVHIVEPSDPDSWDNNYLCH